MKKVFSFLLVLLTVVVADAQTKLPLDESTKLISYTKVNTLTGVEKDDLYARGMAWASTYYKNPADVIREKAEAEGKMVCKARFKVMNPADKKGVATEGGVVQYTLNLQFKNGRYKYEFTEFNWKQQSYYPVEKWMDTANAYYKPEFEFYLQQVDSTAKEIISSLDKAMKTNPVTDKKDNW